MINSTMSRTIKFWIAMGVIAIALVFAGIKIITYSVEGEKKLPYTLSKITVISTAEGLENTTDETDANTWNLDIIQTNDVYFSIDKTQYCKDGQMLTGVKIENIKIIQQPKIGTINSYMPNSLDGRLYNYITDYMVDEKLEYKGATKSNPKTLEIGNQGGIALISFSNSQIGKFESNLENIEIKHDATLLANVTDSEENLKFKVNFDLIIKVDDVEYKTNVDLDLPCGDIIKSGTSTSEITDFSNLIYKRNK